MKRLVAAAVVLILGGVKGIRKGQDKKPPVTSRRQRFYPISSTVFSTQP